MKLLAIFLFTALIALVLFAIYRSRTTGLPPSVRDVFARTFSEDGWLAKLWPLWLMFLVSFAAVGYQNQIKAWLVLYAISKILLAGLVGIVIHWGFRKIHPMPENPSGIEIGTDWKCCTWIIAAAVIALALVP